MANGFFITARSDVRIASIAVACRSSINGNDTTLTHRATTANRKPMPQPTMMSDHPSGVVNTRVAKSGMLAAGGCNVDRVRDGDPGPEQNEQEHAEFEHGAERRCAQHVDSIPRSGFLAALAAAAEFVETERGKRTNQCKTGGQRKQQRQHRIAKDHSEQNKTENGIDHAQHNGVTRHGLEIFPAQAQRGAQVGQADFANDKGAGDADRLWFRTDDVVGIVCGHGRSLPCSWAQR
jgi:hypothetical protein